MLDTCLSNIASRYNSYKVKGKEMDYLQACGSCFTGNVPTDPTEAASSTTEDDHFPPPGTDMWIPSLGLTCHHRAILESCNDHIDKTMMNSILKVVKNTFPNASGL